MTPKKTKGQEPITFRIRSAPPANAGTSGGVTGWRAPVRRTSTCPRCGQVQAARPESAAGLDAQAGDYLRGDPGGHPLAEPELAGRRDEAVQVRFERTTARSTRAKARQLAGDQIVLARGATERRSGPAWPHQPQGCRGDSPHNPRTAMAR